MGRRPLSRSGRTCANAARSRTPSATAADGSPRPTPASQRSPRTRTTSRVAPSSSPTVARPSWTFPRPIGVAPPITSDPPFHAIARRLILPAFAPGPINALEPMIRELCSSLLDGLAGEDVVNAGTKYAQYIPPGVIRGMLGFPEEDIEHFLEFVHIILEGIDHPEEERIIEFEPVEEYFVAQMEDHMDNPRDDLTSYLLNVELDGQNLAMEHVFGTMVLILVAGIDTTWSAIGSAIWHLAHNPEDLDATGERARPHARRRSKSSCVSTHR